MTVSNLPWPAKLFERMLVCKLRTQIYLNLSVLWGYSKEIIHQQEIGAGKVVHCYGSSEAELAAMILSEF